jgi:hypothetical protein
LTTGSPGGGVNPIPITILSNPRVLDASSALEQSPATTHFSLTAISSIISPEPQEKELSEQSLANDPKTNLARSGSLRQLGRLISEMGISSSSAGVVGKSEEAVDVIVYIEE